jgi:ABC-type multidrug transport system ATPase subunit
MTDHVIETRALTKRYGAKLALDALDLSIAAGRIHAIVGANGAGKSTLLRILLGFLPPSSGSARILGRDSQRLSSVEREKRMDEAVSRFVHDVVALDYPAAEAVARIDHELRAFAPNKTA